MLSFSQQEVKRFYNTDGKIAEKVLLKLVVEVFLVKRANVAFDYFESLVL